VVAAKASRIRVVAAINWKIGSRKIGESLMECGCFCCLQTFPAVEVIDWVDDGDTPLCPYCGIAAVLPGVTDLVELLRLQERRFGPVEGLISPDEEV
jgi:NAD-dependent SIR2 family protein deacetylase